MKEIYLSVGAFEDNDYICDVDVEVQMEDDMYDSLAALAAEYRKRGEELTEDDFRQKLPEVYSYISEYVDNWMSEEITLEEGEDIDDFSWSIGYPDDICELFEE